MTARNGKRYLLSTRPGEKFSTPEVECCFEILNVPVTRISERRFEDSEIRRIVDFGPEAIAFTSETGAGIFFRDLSQRLKLRNVDFYGIGPVTCSAVRKEGFDCISPDRRDSEGLAHLLAGEKRDHRVLLFRSGQANKILDETLRDRGVEYLPVKAYDVVSMPQVSSDVFLSENCFGIVFTSALEVESFLKAVREEIHEPSDLECRIFSIGKYTTERLIKKGFTISHPVGNSDFESLLRDICRMYC